MLRRQQRARSSQRWRASGRLAALPARARGSRFHSWGVHPGRKQSKRQGTSGEFSAPRLHGRPKEVNAAPIWHELGVRVFNKPASFRGGATGRATKSLDLGLDQRRIAES